MRSLILLPLIAATALLASCSSEKSASTALALVGTEEVSPEDLLLELKRQIPQGTASEQREAALEQVLRRKRIVAAARADGLGEDPAVKRAIENILINHWIERSIQPQLDAIEVSDEEIARYYQDHPHEFTAPSTTTLAILYRKSRDADILRRREHRNALVKAVAEVEAAGVLASEGFGKISPRNSEDTSSRFRGGLLPTFEADKSYGPRETALIQASRNLAPGECSEVIERPEGLYVVRLVRKSNPALQELLSVEQGIRHKLASKKESEIREEFHEGLQERYPATISKDALSGFAPAPALASLSSEVPQDTGLPRTGREVAAAPEAAPPKAKP